MSTPGPRNRAARRCALALCLASAACSNWHVVEPGRVYRSAQPDAGELAEWIREYDLATVLHLRGGGPGDPEFEASRGPSRAAGIAFVHVPMSSQRFPTKEQLMRLCEVFARASYPMLIHCQAGADRTGLASAVYVLQRTGDLERARAQLRLVPYGHVGVYGTEKLDRVLDLYARWREHFTFCEWVRRVYETPVLR